MVNVPGTQDRAVQLTFNGVSDWTLASYQASGYEPANATQTIVLRVTTPDGSDLTGKTGRIGVGIVGQTGLTLNTCSPGRNYNEASFGGSSLGGIDLSSGKPFPHLAQLRSGGLPPTVDARRHG